MIVSLWIRLMESRLERWKDKAFLICEYNQLEGKYKMLITN